MSKGSHLKVEKLGSDAMGVTLRGDRRQPEPGMFLVRFPGGHVEISRCSDDSYWVHFTANLPKWCVGNDKVPGELADARLDCESLHAGDVDVGDFNRADLYKVAVRIRVRKT